MTVRNSALLCEPAAADQPDAWFVQAAVPEATAMPPIKRLRTFCHCEQLRHSQKLTNSANAAAHTMSVAAKHAKSMRLLIPLARSWNHPLAHGPRLATQMIDVYFGVLGGLPATVSLFD